MPKHYTENMNGVGEWANVYNNQTLSINSLRQTHAHKHINTYEQTKTPLNSLKAQKNITLEIT